MNDGNRDDFLNSDCLVLFLKFYKIFPHERRVHLPDAV